MSVFDLKQRLADKRVILASASPRRKELLTFITDKFEIEPAYGDEIIPEGFTAFFIPVELAEQKCREVVGRCQPDDDTVVIACDTAVVLDNKLYGKPKNTADAKRMLSELSGKTHFVSSGICIYYKGRYRKNLSSASVVFDRLSAEDIEAYVKTGEPMDKAGAYGIQGLGSLMVRKIVGDYYSIVGLPLDMLARMLDEVLD